MQKRLKTLLATGKTEQVIKELLKATENNNDLHGEVVMLASRFEAHAKSNRMGTISYSEGNITLAKINTALLDVIGQYAESKVEENEKTERDPDLNTIPKLPLENSKEEKGIKERLWKWIVAAGILLSILASISQFMGYNFKNLFVCKDEEKTVTDSTKLTTDLGKRKNGTKEIWVKKKVEEKEKMAVNEQAKSKKPVVENTKEGKSLTLNTPEIIPENESEKPVFFSMESMHWMEQNLNENSRKGICYKNKDEFCKKYGKLYTWKEAQEVCPEGWRLSTSDDWVTLGNKPEKLKEYFGKNSFGGRKSKDSFALIGKAAFFWTSSESLDAENVAWGYRVKATGVGKESYDKSSYLSCRCVKDKK